MQDSPTDSNHCIIILLSQAVLTENTIKNLVSTEYAVLVAQNGQQAVEMASEHTISAIVIDTESAGHACGEMVEYVSKNTRERFVPIILLASICNEKQVIPLVANITIDYMVEPFSLASFNARLRSIEDKKYLQRLYNESIDEQLLANRILKSAIEGKTTEIDDIELLSRSKDVFCGDIFLTARHPDGGLNVLMGDFTGHGLSAALGALPVTDVFRAMTAKGFSLESILENINHKLYKMLPSHMFMGCIIMNISNDLTSVTIWNGGLPEVYMREARTGLIKNCIASSHIPLGITESIRDGIGFEAISISPGDQFIIYTDGFSESVNEHDEMFGSYKMAQCFIEHTQADSIYKYLVDTFNNFCGDIAQEDDITLACISCNENLICDSKDKSCNTMQISDRWDDDWHWFMELAGESMLTINPVPIAVNEISLVSNENIDTSKILEIMTSLYNNVIDKYSLNNSIKDDFIRIGIKKVELINDTAVLVRMEVSSNKDSYEELMRSVRQYQDSDDNKEEQIIYEFNLPPGEDLHGNRFDAIIYDSDRAG